MKTIKFNNEKWEEYKEVFCPRCAVAGMWKLLNRDYYICVSCERTFAGRLVETGYDEKKVIELARAEMKSAPQDPQEGKNE